MTQTPQANSNQKSLDEIKGIGLNRYYRDLASELPYTIKRKFPITQYDFPALSYRRSTSGRMIAGMATMPSRQRNLPRVIRRVLIQVDELHVYLNNFRKTPKFLKHPKIRLHRSQENGDLRDNGKFFGLQHASREGDKYFTLDDDIIYPHGYINYLAESLERYLGRAAVGIHGIIYPVKPESFFDRYTFNFTKELRSDVPVSVLGTGTMAFKPNMLDFKELITAPTGMADLVVARMLKSGSHSLICLSRPRHWLSEIRPGINEDSIYSETVRDESRHMQFIRTNAPWGVSIINQHTQKNGIHKLLEGSSIRLIELLKAIETSDAKSYGIISSNIEDFLVFGKLAFAKREKYRELSNALGHGLIDYLQKDKENETRNEQAFIAALPESKITIKSKEDWHEAYSILSDYRSETGDEYVSLILDIIEGHNLTEKTITRLFTFFPAKQIRQLLVLLKTNGKLGLWKLMHAQRYLLIEGLSLEEYLYSKKALILEKATSQQLLIAAASFVSKPKLMKLFLKKFIGSQSSVTQQSQDFFYFTQLMRKSCRQMSTGSIELLLESEAMPTKSKLDLCKTAIDLDWGSNKIAKKWILDNIESLLDHLDARDHAERKLIIAQCYSDRGWRTIDFVNRYNAVANVEAAIATDKGESFFHGLGCVVAAKAHDHGLCTVVITAYNSDETLRYSLDSIIKQTYKNLEIIIVDDGKNQRIESIASVYGDQRIRIIKNNANLGPYRSRNRALAEANGEYIAIQDADDWSHPQRLEKQLNSLHENPTSLASYARHIRFSKHGVPKLENNFEYLGDGPVTSIFKANIFKTIGTFQHVRTRGDMEFKNRIINAYGPSTVVNLDAILVLALDWRSNSKEYTDSIIKESAMKEYKLDYSMINRQFLIFSHTDSRKNL